MTDLERKLAEKMSKIPFEYIPPVHQSAWALYAQAWAEGEMQSLYDSWLMGFKRKKKAPPPHDEKAKRIELFLEKPYATILIMAKPKEVDKK